MIHQEPRLAYGIDLGGTRLRAAQVKLDTGTVQRSLRIATPAGGPKAIVAAMFQLLSKLGLEAGKEDRRGDEDGVCLGVSAPGPLDARRGILFDVPNLPGWSGYPLASALRDALGVNVHVHNDASLAGLAEARFGAGRGFDPLLYVTYSTGIGGGIVVGDRIWGGANGLAGEIGHLVVRDGGPACNLGHEGCAEGIAAGVSLARRANMEGMLGSRSHGDDTDRRSLDTAELARRADSGDPAAQALFVEAGRALGLAVAGGVNLVDPARVVIGGGVSRAWRHFAPAMFEAVESTVLALEARRLDIVPSTLGDDAGLVGAAVHAASETSL